jgi:hypothetical protein
MKLNVKKSNYFVTNWSQVTESEIIEASTTAIREKFPKLNFHPSDYTLSGSAAPLYVTAYSINQKSLKLFFFFIERQGPGQYTVADLKKFDLEISDGNLPSSIYKTPVTDPVLSKLCLSSAHRHLAEPLENLAQFTLTQNDSLIEVSFIKDWDKTSAGGSFITINVKLIAYSPPRVAEVDYTNLAKESPDSEES